MGFKTIEVGEKITFGSPEITRVLKEAADHPYIKLNFARVKEMDTSGIEMLLSVYKNTLKNKGKLRCSNVRDSVRDILTMTGLNKVIDLGLRRNR